MFKPDRPPMTRAEMLAKLLVQSCDKRLPLTQRQRALMAIGEIMKPVRLLGRST